MGETQTEAAYFFHGAKVNGHASFIVGLCGVLPEESRDEAIRSIERLSGEVPSLDLGDIGTTTEVYPLDEDAQDSLSRALPTLRALKLLEDEDKPPIVHITSYTNGHQ